MLGISNDEKTFVGRFENLQSDFLAIMRRLSVDEVDAIECELGKRERKNTSQHSHYSHYYDEELRDLVARKERSLIGNYDYQFEQIGPVDPAKLLADSKQEFQKVLGRASNYLQLQKDFDVQKIAKKIAQVPEEKWLESERERRFDVHRDTQALVLIHFEDKLHSEPDIRDHYLEFEDEIQPLLNHIGKFYQDNGFPVRILFARLRSGGEIPEHTDSGYSLLNAVVQPGIPKAIGQSEQLSSASKRFRCSEDC